jgi:hypothetical protein
MTAQRSSPQDSCWDCNATVDYDTLLDHWRFQLRLLVIFRLGEKQSIGPAGAGR